MRRFRSVGVAVVAGSFLAMMVGQPAVAAQEAKILASDGAAGDLFGYAVAIAGDTAVVGAWRDDDNAFNAGSVYVFTRSGGVWTYQAKLTASDGAAGDGFGRAVAVAGDTVVVGASGDDDSGTSSGSAYVFARSGGVWTEEARLAAPDGAEFDLFGWSVAVAGDTAVIGAHGDDDNGTNSGSAFVFTRSGGTWSEQAKLKAADGAAGDEFSYSVAVGGDTVVVGAFHDDDNGANSGSAYVFTRSGGVWSQQAKLAPLDGAAGDLFGHSVAVAGDTALVGAYNDDDTGTSSGSAYVFTRSGGAWSQEAKLLPAADGAEGDLFGWSVAVAGDTAVVGARRDNDSGSFSGSAYVFTRSSGLWIQQAKLTASDGAANDFFGWSVAVADGTALVGAPNDDDSGADSGSAYVTTQFGCREPIRTLIEVLTPLSPTVADTLRVLC